MEPIHEYVCPFCGAPAGGQCQANGGRVEDCK